MILAPFFPVFQAKQLFDPVIVAFNHTGIFHRKADAFANNDIFLAVLFSLDHYNVIPNYTLNLKLFDFP
ncbi:hypothetical protein D3C75_1265360 [compost metagenome]